MLKILLEVVLPSSQGARSHGHILGPGDCAGEVVGQVHRGLHCLGELDHHHITQGVAVLVVGSVRIRTMCCKDTQTHTKARVMRVEQEVKAEGQKWKMLVSAAAAYAVPRYPLVTTAEPGPRVVQVRLYFMSCCVWMSWLNCTTTMFVIVSPYWQISWNHSVLSTWAMKEMVNQGERNDSFRTKPV